MRRKAASTPLSLIGRSPVPGLGNTYLPWPVKGCSSRRMATACRDSGTTCAVPINFSCFVHFMRAAGIAPLVGIKIELNPLGLAQLAGSNEHERRELKRRPRDRHALVAFDPASERHASLDSDRARRVRSRWHRGTPGHRHAVPGAPFRSRLAPRASRFDASMRRMACSNWGALISPTAAPPSQGNACLVALLSDSPQSRIGIGPQGQQSRLAVEAVLQAPPLAAPGTGDVQRRSGQEKPPSS